MQGSTWADITGWDLTITTSGGATPPPPHRHRLRHHRHAGNWVPAAPYPVTNVRYAFADQGEDCT